MGFPVEAFQLKEKLVVYPGHEQAYRLFHAIGTQWRSGMDGPYGLDYSVAYRWLDNEGIKPSKQNQIITELALIEQGALQAMQERHKQA